MFPAIFLDRDGVIIENRPGYVRSWADVEIYPLALEALARLAQSVYKIVIVTNQSAVGRGLMRGAEVAEINRRLLVVITQSGGRVDGVYVCPHAPDAGCACRKPQPGLFTQAAHDLALNLPGSVMVGDAWSDMQAGFAAGIRRNIFVRTGRGAEQLKKQKPDSVGKIEVFATLWDAVQSILTNMGS